MPTRPKQKIKKRAIKTKLRNINLFESIQEANERAAIQSIFTQAERCLKKTNKYPKNKQ